MAAELTDGYARRRLGDGPWSWVAAPSLRALVDGEPLPARAVADAGAAAAWTEWAGSVRSAETLLVLRLVEPDGRGPGENPWRRGARRAGRRGGSRCAAASPARRPCAPTRAG